LKGKVALLVRHTRSGEVPHPIYIGLVHEHAHYPLRRELVLAVLGRTLSRPCTAAAPAPPPNQQASRQPTAAGMRPVPRHSRVLRPWLVVAAPSRPVVPSKPRSVGPHGHLPLPAATASVGGAWSRRRRRRRQPRHHATMAVRSVGCPITARNRRHRPAPGPR